MKKNSDFNYQVSVIIPNYNGIDLLTKNLPKVVKAAQNFKNRIKEIIVVDDASTDHSVKLLKKSFSTVKIIKHKQNRGFSSAVNTGVRGSKGNLIALINSDVIPSENFLEKTLYHFNEESTFAVSLHEKEYGGARGFFKDGFIMHSPSLESSQAGETFWANGGSGVFRKSMWTQLGGMDEKLFSPFYWEDVDLSYRAMKRGWKIIWEPNSKVLHKHESTIGKISKSFRTRIQERNQLILIWKNLTSPIMFRKHLLGLIKKISLHPGYIKIVFLAVLRLRRILYSRRKEKKEAKVSDEAIFAKFRNE